MVLFVDYGVDRLLSAHRNTKNSLPAGCKDIISFFNYKNQKNNHIKSKSCVEHVSSNVRVPSRERPIPITLSIQNITIPHGKRKRKEGKR